jgi:hypothetical protein
MEPGPQTNHHWKEPGLQTSHHWMVPEHQISYRHLSARYCRKDHRLLVDHQSHQRAHQTLVFRTNFHQQEQIHFQTGLLLQVRENFQTILWMTEPEHFQKSASSASGQAHCQTVLLLQVQGTTKQSSPRGSRGIAKQASSCRCSSATKQSSPSGSRGTAKQSSTRRSWGTAEGRSWRGPRVGRIAAKSEHFDSHPMLP